MTIPRLRSGKRRGVGPVVATGEASSSGSLSAGAALLLVEGLFLTAAPDILAALGGLAVEGFFFGSITVRGEQADG